MTTLWHNQPSGRTTKPARVKDLTAAVKAGTVVRLQDGSLIMRTNKPAKGPFTWVCLWAPDVKYVGSAFSEWEFRIDKVLTAIVFDTDLRRRG